MKVISVRNVHEALPEAVHQMLQWAHTEQTRNGQVLRCPTPVTTVYSEPRERVLFWGQRDANPFFHFFEGLWMLNGQMDVAPLARFVKSISKFSDNGSTFHGAYGYRWRTAFKWDQLQVIANSLRADHSDRRQVLQMWDCDRDLTDQVAKRDIPCNLVICFTVNASALDMTVYNRSNDIVWGCYGANAVHFSMLQEVMAAMVGVPVGVYYQVSNNWHAYQDTFEKVRPLALEAAQPTLHGMRQPNPYAACAVAPYPMVSTDADTWFAELAMFMSEEGSATGYTEKFFRRVAVPLVQAHTTYTVVEAPHRFDEAYAACNNIQATDWRLACQQWILRRQASWRAKR